MGQPIRKKIQEVHSDLIKEPPFRTLLVDGNSLLFKCFADSTVNSDGSVTGAIKQFLLQLRIQLEKGEFEYVYVFFDNEYSGWLRWNIYKDYKSNRDKKYAEYGVSEYMKQYNENLKGMQRAIFSKQEKKAKTGKEEIAILYRKDIDAYKTTNDKKFFTFQVIKKYGKTLGKQIVTIAKKEIVEENFARCRDILCLMFNELYIRWNIDEITEGDDMIAYYCLHKKENERIIIVSGDMDLSQLIADDIAIYNLNLKQYITPTNFKEHFGYYYENTLTKKILCGDSSDNISNIKGLSETGLMEMMPEIKTRKVTVEEVKERAKKLIEQRKSEKKKPYVLHENIVNGISNKEYDGDFYEINEKIIDLHKPLLSDEAKENMDTMMYAPQDPDGRSFKNLYKIILDQNIQDLKSDAQFASFFRPFKRLEEKEIKRYNENS